MNEIKQVTTAEKRVYERDGVTLPSVTTIIGATVPKPALKNWAVKVTCDYIVDKLLDMGPVNDAIATHFVALEIVRDARKESTRIKEAAADIGTAVHDLAEAWALARIYETEPPTVPTEPPAVLNAYMAFLKWAEEVRLTPLYAEIDVWNERVGYAGRLDLIARIRLKGWHRPRIYVIDLKSSNGHWPEHAYQVAGYAGGLKGVPEEIEGIGVLRLDKVTGRPDFKDYTPQWSLSWRIFKGLCATYADIQKMKPKKEKK